MHIAGKFLVLIGVLASCTGVVLAQDIPGSKDHPVLPRYEDSAIRAYKTEAFVEYDLVAGKTVQQPNASPARIVSEKPIRLEGKLTHILYRAPLGRSPLEVFRNYEKALKAAGFETLFTCDRDNCGTRFNSYMNPGARYNGLIYGDQQRFISAKLSRPEGDIYVALYVTSFEPEKRAFALLEVVEVKGLEDRLIVIGESEIEKSLARDGRIAIYGILFDFDKAEIKPESAPQLEQLAAVLKKNPKLGILIVGHTDGKGAFEYNLSLSQRRAQAVVTMLVSRFGIQASRLIPAGAGMAAPVASNRSEAGRAKNRRVEIVERYSGD
jgi:OOP family OmpA-OmpF porin